MSSSSVLESMRISAQVVSGSTLNLPTDRVRLAGFDRSDDHGRSTALTSAVTLTMSGGLTGLGRRGAQPMVSWRYN